MPTEKISQRAYEIWEAEGRPEGRDLEHWLQAETEIVVLSKNWLKAEVADIAPHKPAPVKKSPAAKKPAAAKAAAPKAPAAKKPAAKKPATPKA